MLHRAAWSVVRIIVPHASLSSTSKALSRSTGQGQLEWVSCFNVIGSQIMALKSFCTNIKNLN